MEVKIYGLTNEQILEMRTFWMYHHLALPFEEEEKVEVTMSEIREIAQGMIGLKYENTADYLINKIFKK